MTTNLPFDEWTEVFGSERLTGALLDRLTHHVHILEMNGESYRLRAAGRAPPSCQRRTGRPSVSAPQMPMPDRRQCGGPHPAPGRQAPPQWSSFTPPGRPSFGAPLTNNGSPRKALLSPACL